MGGPSVNPSHGHHHDAPAATGIASPSGKTLPPPPSSSSSEAAARAAVATTTTTTISPTKKSVGTSTAEGVEEEQQKAVVRKREDYISWDDYFMGVAFLSAMRSKDPSTQVGACLVDEENKIVGIGTWVAG